MPKKHHKIKISPAEIEAFSVAVDAGIINESNVENSSLKKLIGSANHE